MLRFSTTTHQGSRLASLPLKFSAELREIIRLYEMHIHGDVQSMFWGQVSRKLEEKYHRGSPGPKEHNMLASHQSTLKILVWFEIYEQVILRHSTILFSMIGSKPSMLLMDLSLVNGLTCASTSACKPSSTQMTHLLLCHI